MGQAVQGVDKLIEQSPLDAAVRVDDDVIAQVLDLYMQGRNLAAYEVCERVGPIACWTGTRARIMGGRLANNLGGMRLGRFHHIHAWREDTADPEAIYYYARTVLERK